MIRSNHNTRRRVALGTITMAVTLPLAAISCGGDGASGNGDGAGAEPAPQVVTITAEDRAGAKVKFDMLCYTCHGKTGAGDGPGSGGLVPKPRNFQDAEWQASVTDEHIEKIIVSGGAAVGKALTMPPNPDLKSKPGIVAALREHIRSLGKNQ